MKVNLSRYRGKSKVKVEPHDLYSLDVTLSKIIIPCLEEFLKVQYLGAPGSFVAEHYPEVENEDYPGEVFTKWRNCLGEMLEGFKLHLEAVQGTGDFVSSEHEQQQQQKIQKAIDLFAKYYTALWT